MRENLKNARKAAGMTQQQMAGAYEAGEKVSGRYVRLPQGTW